jgi:hypothetical protein
MLHYSHKLPRIEDTDNVAFGDEKYRKKLLVLGERIDQHPAGNDWRGASRNLQAPNVNEIQRCPTVGMSGVNVY